MTLAPRASVALYTFFGIGWGLQMVPHPMGLDVIWLYAAVGAAAYTWAFSRWA
jgi:hypothetical protein